MNTNSSILITGASGLAGGWLLESLFNKGYTNLHALDVAEPTHPCNFYKGSITDKNFLCHTIRNTKPAAVFHLAGIFGHRELEEMIEVNVTGTDYLLESLYEEEFHSSPILITSSSSVYGDKGKQLITEEMSTAPTTNYSISKAKQEEVGLSWFKDKNLPVIISRVFNNFAPGEKEHMFISRIASQIVKIEKGQQEILQIGPLFSYRDYLDTRDLVEAYIKLMKNGIPGEIYNACSGEAVQVQSMFEYLIGCANKPINVEIVLYDQKGNIPYQCGSSKKLYDCTGWKKEHDVKRTLSEILIYWREKYSSLSSM